MQKGDFLHGGTRRWLSNIASILVPKRAGSVRFERASLDLNSLVQWHRDALHNTTLPHLVFMKAWTLVSRRGGICICASHKYTFCPESFRADRELKEEHIRSNIIYLFASK